MPPAATSLPPGPSLPRPIVAVPFLLWPTTFLEGCLRRYGDPFTLPLAPGRTLVLTTDPEEIKRLFTGDADELHAGEGNAVLGPLLGRHSLLLLDGDEHMSQRKLLLPPFHGRRMEAYADVMRRVAERDIATWPSGRAFPVLPHTQAITLEVIMRAVFGIRDAAGLEELGRLLRAVLDLGTSRRRLLPLLFGLVAGGDSRAWRRFQAATEAVDHALYAEIARRRSAADTAQRDDVMSLLLQARHEDGSLMSDRELRDELMTLLVAGHETTATALAWTLERLARHPHVLDRLVADVDEHGANGDYLDAVVKETLRLRPVVPAVARRVTVPWELRGHTLPAGTIVTPSIYLTHRRPDVYPEPDRFRPARFLEQPAGTYTWIPFGGGVRRCLGGSFAVFEMKVVLATALGRMRLRSRRGRGERIARRAITFAPVREGRIVVTPRQTPAPAVPRPVRAAA